MMIHSEKIIFIQLNVGCSVSLTKIKPEQKADFLQTTFQNAFLMQIIVFWIELSFYGSVDN